MSKRTLNRRGFLKAAGTAGVAGVALGVGGKSVLAQTPAPTPAPTMAMPSQGSQGQAGTMSADEMDKMMEAGVKAFLDNIDQNLGEKYKQFWGENMPFTMDGDTKVFDVTATEGDWEVAPGQVVKAMLYNGRVPGPVIRMTQGEKVRIVHHNQMSQSTVMHIHGLHTPNAMDGVGFITQKPIKPGETFNYEFVAKNSGTHMYHSHHNAAEQVTRGLLGAFIVDPADKNADPQVSAEYMMVLNDAGIGITINGKSFPATQPIIAKIGDKIRVRYMNEGLMIHPMHLHGMYQSVIAKDGVPFAIPYLVDTLLVAPGERYDVLIDCLEPGVWAYHCHILTHAETSTGMYGMVTALIIK
ncbi:MAG TPA: multicopper oxidase domain-containing protein [Aggregatilineales bacterium]|nr:multicopper oxidase domain-containing protein [Aggregatilineales bacterium]